MNKRLKFSEKHLSFLRVTHSVKIKNIMKLIVNILMLICAVKAVIAMKKCGILEDRCQLLTNGDMFWPSDYDRECSAIPICPKGFALHKEIIGNLRACCCKVKRISDCPDCDMTITEKEKFSEWIDLHIERNGPPDGLCSNNKVKRIFFGGFNQLDKCCCEPKDSPFTYMFSTE